MINISVLFNNRVGGNHELFKNNSSFKVKSKTNYKFILIVKKFKC